MRLATPMLTVKAFLLFSALFQAAHASATERVIGNGVGLGMVPAQCADEDKARIPIDEILVFHNKVIKFNLNGTNVISELVGGRVYIKYSDQGGVSFAKVTEIIRYGMTDVRLYHATIASKPVILWEEIVENIPGRAGIIEYRGKGIFPLCDGLIRKVDRIPYLLSEPVSKKP